MGLKPKEETNTKMEGKGMIWCCDKRQRKDPHKLLKSPQWLHLAIDKIQGLLKKL